MVYYSDELQKEIFFIDSVGLQETPSKTNNKKMFDLFFSKLFESIYSCKEIFEIWYNKFSFIDVKDMDLLELVNARK